MQNAGGDPVHASRRGRNARYYLALAKKRVFSRPCPHFAQTRLSLSNQGLCRLAKTLRTLLSTETVQNFFPQLYFPPALFLRSTKFVFKINELRACQDSCAQSYPQKMCRTALAVWLATRYIAGVCSDPVRPLLRSLFCSPFFKLQAGQSGYC